MSRTNIPVLAVIAAIIVIAVVVLAVAGGFLREPPASVSGDPAPAAVGEVRWLDEAMGQDWPGPFRGEPVGRPAIVPSAKPPGGFNPFYLDPVGDVPRGLDVVDIRRVKHVQGCWFDPAVCISFEVAQSPPRRPDPRVRWLGYGIVVDENGDGRPDLRFGVDNDAGSRWGYRMWRTDLATGETRAYRDTLEDPRVMDAVFPEPRLEQPEGVELPVGSIFVHQPGPAFRFYVWASMIADGRVVTTDYAPDFGWVRLEPPEP